MKILQISLNCSRDIPEKSLPETAFSLYIFRTPVIITINGNDTAMYGNSALLLTYGCKKNFRSLTQKNVRFDCINFRPSSADKQYMTTIKLPVNTPVKIIDDFSISSSVKAMKTNFVRQGKSVNDLMELYMKIIFILISDSYLGIPEKSDVLIPRYSELKAVRNSIYANPSSEWNAEDICMKLEISRTYFHRLYREAFGITFLRDVIESRLIRGSELLTTTNLAISIIAEKCGYENESYFMRQFKKYRNCTPSEYRKKAANQNID